MNFPRMSTKKATPPTIKHIIDAVADSGITKGSAAKALKNTKEP